MCVFETRVFWINSFCRLFGAKRAEHPTRLLESNPPLWLSRYFPGCLYARTLACMHDIAPPYDVDFVGFPLTGIYPLVSKTHSGGSIADGRLSWKSVSMSLHVFGCCVSRGSTRVASCSSLVFVPPFLRGEKHTAHTRLRWMIGFETDVVSTDTEANDWSIRFDLSWLRSDHKRQEAEKWIRPFLQFLRKSILPVLRSGFVQKYKRTRSRANPRKSAPRASSFNEISRYRYVGSMDCLIRSFV
jgi:hypothetical protein